MNILLNILLDGIAVYVASLLLSGVHINNFGTALIVAIVLGVVNALIKPLIVILTLPITIITLGLFYFVINGILILLVAFLVPGFKVDGFLWAILLSIVLSLISWFLHRLA